MSSMLEQAIVDAQALREAALKNAEQALIEKFAPQIKDAVESLLEESASAPAKKRVKYEGQIYNVMEVEDGKYTLRNETTKPFVVSEAEVSALSEDDLLQEEEGATAASGGSTPIEAPPAFGPGSNLETPVEFSTQYEEPVYEFDLSELQVEEEAEQEEEPAEEPEMDLGAKEEPAEEGGDEGDDILAGLDLQEGIELHEDDDELVNEIMNLVNEMYDEEADILEEELVVDMGAGKDGTFRTDKETLEYYRDMQSARDIAISKAEEEKEKNKSLKKENENLKETLKRFKLKNKQYKDAVEKLSDKLNETLLSNAKLIYSNKTLGDASLNERQKNKIVEAITKARTPEEAKNLHEALNATVTSGQDKKSPRTLSESVQRKSTLSGILPRRKQQVNESEEHTFADHMKKLAGIK